MVQYLKKLINSFHNSHFDKPTETFSTINTAAPIARPTTKPTEPFKKKEGQSTKRRATKHDK